MEKAAEIERTIKTLKTDLRRIAKQNGDILDLTGFLMGRNLDQTLAEMIEPEDKKEDSFENQPQGQT